MKTHFGYFIFISYLSRILIGPGKTHPTQVKSSLDWSQLQMPSLGGGICILKGGVIQAQEMSVWVLDTPHPSSLIPGKEAFGHFVSFHNSESRRTINFFKMLKGMENFSSCYILLLQELRAVREGKIVRICLDDWIQNFIKFMG